MMWGLAIDGSIKLGSNSRKELLSGVNAVWDRCSEFEEAEIQVDRDNSRAANGFEAPEQRTLSHAPRTFNENDAKTGVRDMFLECFQFFVTVYK